MRVQLSLVVGSAALLVNGTAWLAARINGASHLMQSTSF
jgi:hypothetical protein